MTGSVSLSQPDKSLIAGAFSRAASSYDASANMQRIIGHQLLSYLPDTVKATCWVDLGCGTGYFAQHLKKRFPYAYGIGLDLAEGMLKQARNTSLADSWLVADAESLPLQNESTDIIFSNLALQWCHDFPKVLQEAYRVLRPGGVFLFTSLCDGTLHELTTSWRAVDDYQHVNTFITFDQYQTLITTSDFNVMELTRKPDICYYHSVKELMHDLKGIGAHNINPERRRYITTRQAFQQLYNEYEQFSVNEGLPATYQTLYCYLVK